MRKIAVIGSAGSGKSVLARALGDITQIPVYHLDAWYWKSGWQPSMEKEWEAVQRELVQRDQWIMDGMYTKSLSIRLSACDTVIFLDLPPWLTTYRAIKRNLQYRGQTRPDLAAGCVERWSWEFVKFVWTFRQKKRSEVLHTLEAFPTRAVITLRTPREVRDFLNHLRLRWDAEIPHERGQ